MTVEIRMLKLASDMQEADLIGWLVEVGQPVERGAVIAEIETDKSTLEIEAPASGTLSEIRIAAGTQAVPVGALLGQIEATPQAADESERAAAGEPRAEAPVPDTAPAPTTAEGAAQATALARRLAARTGIDVAAVNGSGARGRVTREDVERQLASEPTEPPATNPSAPPELGHDSLTVPHTRMRRTIARRLGEAKRTIPHFYLSAPCRMDRALAMRAHLNGRPETPRISINDFVIRAAALALREVPEANASWTEDAIIRHANVDISVAVAVEEGLITPVVREADRKGLAAISREMRDLATRARAGKLAPRDYRGGGFSISNLGMYGVESVWPIVNPPESCILGVGAVREIPLVRDGAVEIGRVISLTLSADHRVVDGAFGAKLLATIRRLLEEPLEMAR